jgi:hypothetical protein
LIQVSALPTFCWNNTGDAVVLTDESGTVADSVWYRSSWGGTGGHSLERIDPWGAANDSTNWASSSDPGGATPGRENSIALRDHDLRVSGCRSDAAGAGVQLRVTVRNTGRFPSGSFGLLAYCDVDGDSTGDPGELIARVEVVHQLLPRDSTVCSVPWPGAPCGLRHAIALVDYPEDERIVDNSGLFVVAVPCPERRLIVNEIMYAPFAGEPEYVELYNPSQEQVDVAGWGIHDRPTVAGAAAGCMIAESSRVIPPDGFLVLAADSGIGRRFPFLAEGKNKSLVLLPSGRLSLNNAGDDVVLTDPSCRMVDSVAYLPAWHHPEFTDVSGRSLERILPLGGSCDPRNWSTSVVAAGGTPGLRNSVAAASPASGSALSFSPNPFSPDGDGVEDFVVVHYELRMRNPLISVKIFDVRGRLIRRLVNNEPSSGQGEVIWDGMDDQRRKARIGIYVVLVEGIDGAGGILETVKGALVVAGRL